MFELNHRTGKRVRTMLLVIAMMGEYAPRWFVAAAEEISESGDYDSDESDTESDDSPSSDRDSSSSDGDPSGDDGDVSDSLVNFLYSLTNFFTEMLAGKEHGLRTSSVSPKQRLSPNSENITVNKYDCTHL